MPLDGFYTMCIQGMNTLEDTMWPVTLLNEGEKCFFVKRNLCIQGNIYESKKEIIKFCNKLSMKVNVLVKFNREKYVPKNITLTANLIFAKLKLWRRRSANTHLKLFLRL